MARKSRGKSPNAVTYTGFFHLHRELLMCSDFQSLDGNALKLLICIGAQYNGYNNGDLCATPSVLRRWGWYSKSNQQLTKRLKELLEKDLVMLTKQGGLHMGPNLYAITWQPIDECGGKLEVSPTSKPPRSFNKLSAPHRMQVRRAPR